MNALSISGGKPLSGSVRVQGAKNSVLPILAATILSREPCVIHNCPGLLDVEYTIRILRHLGCNAEQDKDGNVSVSAADMSGNEIPDSLMRKMRSSVIFMGSILSRTGEAVLSRPGGCDLGPRPIGLHLAALRQMGAKIREEGGNIFCSATELVGCEITLEIPSVGATENIMLAAAKAQGHTRIINAAREPEIEDLQAFINAMGGRVSGAGSSFVTIEGVETLHGAEHRVIPDRIAAATLLSAVAAAGGDALLNDIRTSDISAVLTELSNAGCIIGVEGASSVRIRATRRPKSMGHIRTAPHPGFPTDAQPVVMSVACIADGMTVFRETMFEHRYNHVSELIRMGAKIDVMDKTAVIHGVPKLSGATVAATDLRSGASLVVAALAAEGTSEVSGLEHIDRGYDKLEDTLASMGAEIRRT
ncbi:MAG: UDP-N-acetylglucosamine 1-carboxyvinyltransferase [Oscillospiraceae bacterium]|jgi:UDP-N-acetylglucosamine 1-carboxyvinyltransferase|nr:UDP-N-acetylglucosamine 1-carboxyvinyltransferase [Oscillospiraceae bacterium]